MNRIKIYVLFNLAFANHTLLSCFCPFLVNPVVIAQNFNPTTEPTKPTEIPNNYAKAKIEQKHIQGKHNLR